MENITTSEQLREAIKNLEIDRDYKLEMLKLQFNITLESIKPGNLIKNKIKDVIASPDLKNSLINGAIGLAVGILSKNLLVNVVANPLKKILGNIIQFGVAGVVSNNGNAIRSEGKNWFQKIFHRKAEA